jgi:hypothetical protein
MLRLVWDHKLWWLIPLAAVLVVFGLLILFAAGVGPFAWF